MLASDASARYARRQGPRQFRAAAIAALITTAAVVAGCGGGGQTSTSRHAARPAPAALVGQKLDGPTLVNPAPEPPLALRNYLGQPVDLASDRGHATLVTFIYTHCPDVCPLIVANLHNALHLMGSRSSEVRVVAVSTDPRGDTRAAVGAFLRARQMTGQMQYLVGTRRQLVPIWRAWGVSVADPTRSDEVAHSAVVYGISASGKIMTAYPSNFTPPEIVHDVPLLLRQ